MTYDFLIVNDIQQILPPSKFGGGPWIHLATVVTPARSFAGKTYPAREFICFKHKVNHKTYIEEVDLSSKGYIKRITDDSLWKELAEFLTNKSILAAAAGKEFKIATKKK
tara:strand:+ start:684 stop:1013 length:330 start_codon:yes stop_codon:yes gene_type:complete